MWLHKTVYVKHSNGEYPDMSHCYMGTYCSRTGSIEQISNTTLLWIITAVLIIECYCIDIT